MWTHTIKTANDLRKFSYYTLCRLADVTKYADPINGTPHGIASGKWKGILTVDALGNFLSFE